jgi:hypothetical protein
MKNAIYQRKRFLCQILIFGQLLTLVDIFMKKKDIFDMGQN